jgi:hypothetical protein
MSEMSVRRFVPGIRATPKSAAGVMGADAPTGPLSRFLVAL